LYQFILTTHGDVPHKVRATVLFTSGAWLCSFPFVLSEPEDLNHTVIYVEGSCKANDRLLLADLQHNTYFWFYCFNNIGGSSLLDYSN